MITDYNNTCSIHNRHYTDEKFSDTTGKHSISRNLLEYLIYYV